MASRPRAPASPDPLGEALRAMRRERGLSQMELSLRLGVSQRHLGFVELGRARASRALLLRLLDVLEVPASRANGVLHQAGFPPRGLAPAEGDRLLSALGQMTDAHFPMPAILFDAEWQAIRLSEGSWWLCGHVMPGLWTRGDAPLDMIAAVAAPNGLLSRVTQPEPIAAALLAQFRAEAWARPSLAPRVAACERALTERYGPLASARDPGSPSLSMTFDTVHGPLSFLALQTVPGIPQDVSLGSIRAELWFPLDDATRRIMAREVPLPRT